MKRSMCPYIPTKVTGMHGGPYTDISTIKAVIQGIMNKYDKYRRYVPKGDIGTESLGKAWKGIAMLMPYRKVRRN